MKTLENFFVITQPKNDKTPKRHYIKAKVLDSKEPEINLVMNEELMYGDINFY